MRRIALTLVLGMAAMAAAGQTPAFEVASIKPFQFLPGVIVSRILSPSPIRVSGNGVNTRGNVSSLVLAAYNLKGFQISGSPPWANTEWYEITAKAEGDEIPTMDQARQMLQILRS